MFKNLYVWIKLFYNLNETPLIAAIENENIEIVKLLLTKENIDVNIPKILILLIDKITKYLIYKWHLKYLYLNHV